MVIRDVCPRCQSPKYKKNGHIHNGKQNHHCHDCGRQFVQCFEQYLIADDRRASHRTLAGGTDFVARHLSRGGCHTQVALGFSRPVLLRHCLIISMSNPSPVSSDVHDATAWRWKPMKWPALCRRRRNKQWIWIAMDATTRQVIAFHVGDRSRKSAKRLWAKIPDSVPSARHILHGSVCGVRRGDSRGAAPGDQQVGPQNQSHRAVQQHAAAARFASGT